MLSGMIGSIMGRLAGGDPAVLKAMRRDPAMMQRLGDPRLVLAMESINLDPNKLAEFQDDREVMELLDKVARLAGTSTVEHQEEPPEEESRLALPAEDDDDELPELIPEPADEELDNRQREEEVRRRFAELQSRRSTRARWEVGANATQLEYDVKDWEKRMWYERSATIGQVLAQKGFCILRGNLDSSELEKALSEAQKLKKSGGFMRPPREILSGLFGELASAWTRELSDPNMPAPPEDRGMRACDAVLEDLASEIAGVAEGAFHMRIKGRTVGVAHLSRMAEDRPNPPLVDPDEADGYMMLFMRKKLKMIYYVGPVNAVMRIFPIGDEIQDFKTTIQAGTIVALRGDVCRCCIDPLSSQPGLSIEVDYLAEEKLGPQENVRDRVPPPDEIVQWYEQRLKAIVDNDVVENVPDDWVKLARSTFFKETAPPTGLCELAHTLPTTVLPEQQWVAPFSACTLGGSDGVSEIPSSKWDMSIYYDEDPMNVDNYKMYTRHMGIISSSSDYTLSEFGLTPQEAADVDPRYIRLCESVTTVLGTVGMTKEDIHGRDVGVFLGLSGNEMQYQMMSGKARLTKTSYINSSNATSVGRLTYLLGSTGPGLSVDTEDSSGAAALDSSVAYLRMDRCSLAIVSSVSLIQHPLSLIVHCAAGTISWSGRCRVFDESADGNVRSEGVVAALLKVVGRARAEDEDQLCPGDCRAMVMGTALNSKGVSSSLTAPSGTAILDVLQRALRDASYPVSILQAVEMNAGGSALADTMELGVMQKALTSVTADSAVVLRNFKCVHGDTGPASGLVSLAKSCFLLTRVVHGPAIHLRELSELAEDVTEEPDDSGPTTSFLISTEALEAANVAHHAGINSFSTSGTSVHQILWGARPEEERRVYSGAPIPWFPASADRASERGSVAEESSECLPMMADYYIIGSWNTWERPIKMQQESLGEWTYVIKLGENRWETFQIWIEGDQDRVLHPPFHMRPQESVVMGPSAQQQVGRFLNWAINGRPDKVCLINEDQYKALREQALHQGFAEWERTAQCNYAVAFRGGYKPTGHENATHPSEMPELVCNSELIGSPGDLYRVRLLLSGNGKYRKVEWRKLPASVPPRMAQDFYHAYYVVGDFSFWLFDEMEASGEGRYAARVQLLAPSAGFQIVRDQDWDQCFFPNSGSGQDSGVQGPSAMVGGRVWTIEGKPGDVFIIGFRRFVDEGGQDRMSIGWQVQMNAPYDVRKITRDFKYYVAGSSSEFRELSEMAPNEDRSVFVADVRLGESGTETFQILLHGNWASLVHPNLRSASFRSPDHEVQGPHSWGMSNVWAIGQDKEDEAEPGCYFRVFLGIEDGYPRSIHWKKLLPEQSLEASDAEAEAPDETEELCMLTVDAGCQSSLDGLSELEGPA
mmetsp:Transcript_6355/g.18130  ORF Transcript_6355/g.18130 Transcript_6355/m.18130 type:complete len:1387 (+) Transcript_6355:32-4192(+)